MSAGRSSPEIALLLNCARVEVGSGDAGNAEMAALARAVESWELFCELASRHAIVPLVNQKFSRVAAGTIPAEVLVSMRAAAEQGALQSLSLAGDLVTVAKALASASVEVIPFKGPTLAALVYGNLSLRQFQDLDLLVHTEDVERSRALLLELGYEAVLSFDEDQRASLMLSGHHEQFTHREMGRTIELHWSLNNRSLTRDSFEHHWWENRQEVSIGGAQLHTLGVEQLLLYLCMHGGKHSWGRLSWLCDFQRALSRYPDADWDRVWALAAENGAVRMVEIGLSLVDSLLGGSSHTVVAARGMPRDAEVGALSEVIANRLLLEAGAEAPALDFNVQLRSRERRRDRLRYTWHVLIEPHPADVQLLGLPRALHGMYFILRPLRLTFKYLGRRLRPSRVA